MTIIDARPSPFASRPPPSTTSQTHRSSFSTPSVPSIPIPLPLLPDTSRSAPSSARVASPVGSPLPPHLPRPSSPCPPLWPRSSFPAPLYSLPPLPPWLPTRSEYPPEKSFKVLVDSAINKDRDLTFTLPMDKVQEASAAETRIKTKETLLRVDGEVVRGEPAIVLVDPRRAGGFKRLPRFRPFRIELYEVKYEVRGITLFTTTSRAHWAPTVQQEFHALPPLLSVLVAIGIRGTDPETLLRIRTDPCIRTSNRQGYW